MTELIDAGVDFIRLTSNNPAVMKRLEEAAFNIHWREDKEGQKVQAGGLLGFYGRKSKHCFFGRREDWVMLQVSGYRARDCFMDYKGIAAHCTRLDIQLTVRSGEKASAIIANHEDESNNAKPANGRHWDTTLIRKNRKAETLYIGSRSSELYGRIYDKYQESKKAIYKDAVRYELEAKDKASRALWDALLVGKLMVQMLPNQAVKWFKAHGINVIYDGFTEIAGYEVSRETPTNEKRLGWLTNQVAATVARLWADGLFFQVWQALLSKILTDSEICAMMMSRLVTEVCL